MAAIPGFLVDIAKEKRVRNETSFLRFTSGLMLDGGVQERAVGCFPIMIVKNSRISFGNSFTTE